MKAGGGKSIDVGDQGTPARRGDGPPPALSRLDFIARLADAWDYRGDQIFRADESEHRALLNLAGLDPSLSNLRWRELDSDARLRLLIAARRAIEFGRLCAWVFGQGDG